MTLTHTCNTPWADSAVAETPEVDARSGRLFPFGRAIIREMNRLGMLVDLSHVSADAMRDALDEARAPVIFSHSSARAVKAHERNVPDDVLFSTAVNRGIVMINFSPTFVGDDEGYADVLDVADHVNYVKDVIGADFVGIGADYNGVTNVPEGLEDVSKYPVLFTALADDGWSDEDLAKLAQRNILRVMREVEAVAEVLREAEEPEQEWISQKFVPDDQNGAQSRAAKEILAASVLLRVSHLYLH